MRFLMAGVLVLIGLPTFAQTNEELITDAVAALPAALRDGAKVTRFDPTSRELVTLRDGTNGMICWADEPDAPPPEPLFYVTCFPESLEPLQNRGRELRVTNTPNGGDILFKEIESGEIPLPEMAIRYTLRGAAPERAIPLATIYVPGATAEGTGLSTQPDHFRPWLMWPGTPLAHVMLPGQ